MGLFGGTKKINVLTSDQRRLLKDLTGELRGQIGEAGPVYEGDITPDATANQQAAFQGVGGLLGSAQQANPAIESMLRGESAVGVDAERYYQDSVYAPAKLAYEDAQRELEARYGGSWGQTGGFQDIMQENAARFGVGLGQQLSDLAYNERNVANDQRSQGIQASFGQQGGLADAYQQILGTGGQERAIAGQENAEAYNKWQAGQDYNNPWLGFLGPALGTQAYAVGQQQGIIPGIAGAVGSVGQGLGAMQPL